jgi:hypothetical protein
LLIQKGNRLTFDFQVFRNKDPDLFDSFSNEVALSIDRVGPGVFSSSPYRPFPRVDEIVVSMTEELR